MYGSRTKSGTTVLGWERFAGSVVTLKELKSEATFKPQVSSRRRSGSKFDVIWDAGKIGSRTKSGTTVLGWERCAGAVETLNNLKSEATFKQRVSSRRTTTRVAPGRDPISLRTWDAEKIGPRPLVPSDPYRVNRCINIAARIALRSIDSGFRYSLGECEPPPTAPKPSKQSKNGATN